MIASFAPRYQMVQQHRAICSELNAVDVARWQRQLISLDLTYPQLLGSGMGDPGGSETGRSRMGPGSLYTFYR